MIETSRAHYEGLLAGRYTWLYGGLENKLAESESFFREHQAEPRGPGGQAADLGAGSGFQTLPLAEAGFSVDAVDLSPTLLRELEQHARERELPLIPTGNRDPQSGGRIRTVEADLVDFLAGRSEVVAAESYELIVCMGDTLPHLPSVAAVEAFLEAAHQKLEPGGRFILGFRDLSVELAGLDRFIPVQSDAQRIFTCFLEYESDEHVVVHDLIYEILAPGSPWEFHKSCYRKVRVSPNWVTERLLRLGFRIAHEKSVRGFTTIIAAL